jgi:hypothetical protein
MLKLCLLAQFVSIIHSFQFHPTAPLCVGRCLISAAAAPVRRIWHAHSLRKRACLARMALAVDSQTNLDAHIPIDLEYPGLRKVRCNAFMRQIPSKHLSPICRVVSNKLIDFLQIYSSPDIYIIEDFLTGDECDSIMQKALSSNMQRSPGSYLKSHDAITMATIASRGYRRRAASIDSHTIAHEPAISIAIWCY